jgi:hypothetical protein
MSCKTLRAISEVDTLHPTLRNGAGPPDVPWAVQMLHPSLDLNALVNWNINVPLLSANRITHLLWVDDYVLLALDGTGLQAMLNVLLSYCLYWGLNVNVNKTAVLVFNPGGRLLNESHTFTLGENLIFLSKRVLLSRSKFYPIRSYQKCPKQTETKRLICGTSENQSCSSFLTHSYDQ